MVTVEGKEAVSPGKHSAGTYMSVITRRCEVLHANQMSAPAGRPAGQAGPGRAELIKSYIQRLQLSNTQFSPKGEF